MWCMHENLEGQMPAKGISNEKEGSARTKKKTTYRKTKGLTSAWALSLSSREHLGQRLGTYRDSACAHGEHALFPTEPILMLMGICSLAVTISRRFFFYHCPTGPLSATPAQRCRLKAKDLQIGTIIKTNPTKKTSWIPNIHRNWLGSLSNLLSNNSMAQV